MQSNKDWQTYLSLFLVTQQGLEIRNAKVV